jgi:hypothetical protein
MHMSSIFGNLAAFLPSPLREIIGGQQRLIRRTTEVNSLVTRTRDSGVGDYAFWDKARHGKARGLEISGLLLKPLGSKVASWTMGTAPTFEIEDNPEAAELLNQWWLRQHPIILQAFEDSVDLGDFFLVVNGDLSLTPMPPHVIKPMVTPTDYATIAGWMIEDIYTHPTEAERQMKIVEQYLPEGRRRRVYINSILISDEYFPNLIGEVPVIHIPNNVASDEIFGRPEGEALVPMLQRYGELLDAAMTGSKRQGRPTPVIENMGSAQEVKAFWDQYSKQVVRTLPDGTTQTEQEIVWDADKLMTLSGTARFEYKSPSPFTGDTERLLGLLFYLYIQHSELPEWVLGNAIASSRASAETQVEPLVKFIEKKRSAALKWMLQLARVALGYIGLFEPAARRAILSDAEITVRWDNLTNENQALTLQALQWLYENNLIDDELALAKAPVEVPNPQEVLERARAEAAERQAAFDAQQDARLREAEARAQSLDAPDTPEEQPRNASRRVNIA